MPICSRPDGGARGQSEDQLSSLNLSSQDLDYLEWTSWQSIQRLSRCSILNHKCQLHGGHLNSSPGDHEYLQKKIDGNPSDGCWAIQRTDLPANVALLKFLLLASQKQHRKQFCKSVNPNFATDLTLSGTFFINVPLYCLSYSYLISLHPSCLAYSSTGRVRDVTGGCLFNESSLEGVMKSTLTPLTTRLISSQDTRQHAAAFCSLARGCHRPKGQIKDSLNATDTYHEKLKTDHQSLFWSNSYHFSLSSLSNNTEGIKADSVSGQVSDRYM